jgi:hypothetical protein
MAEAQEPPNEGEATPPTPPPPEKAAAKKTPAKKAPQKKAAPAKKAPAKAADAAKQVPPKKAPAKKAVPAIEPAVEPPALEPPAPHAALVAGNGSPPLADAAREAAANAKSSVEQATNPVSRPPVPAVPEAGRSPLPFAVAFALTVLLALLVRRLRHRPEG